MRQEAATLPSAGGDHVAHACTDLSRHDGPGALAEHLGCLEERLWYSLHGLAELADAMAERAEAERDGFSAVRARLIAADVRSRMGDPTRGRAEQAALAERAQNWPVLQCRAWVGLTSSCDRLGQRAESMAWITRAVQSWPDGEQPGWHAEALMTLAMGAVSHSNVDYALLEQAVRAVRTHCSPLLLSVTLANFAEVSAECGDLARSTEFADSAAALLERHPEALATLSLDSIARSRLAVGELSMAAYDLRLALELEEELGCSDVLGDPWLTLAEVELARGDPDAALASMNHPRRETWAAKSAWTRSRDLDIRAEILAAQGNWQQAYGTLREHLAAYNALRSLEDDRTIAESENRHLADTERRRAAEFERLALTDPLTSLPNRRRVEQWLADIAQRSDPAAVLTVAILDLDHFKRINDHYSHDIGDEVLRRVSEVLAPPGGLTDPDVLVGRLGGEEFVRLCLHDSGAAVQNGRRTLAQLRALRWDDVAPGLRVTASIGIASGPTAEAKALMQDADRRLYAAKRAGRDRIVDG